MPQLHLSNGLTGGLATNIDIKPPGVREQRPNGTLLQIFPLRSSLYDSATGTDNVNVPPLSNWGDNVAMPPYMQSKWNRDVGTQWYEITQQTPTQDWWYTHELGNFSVPSTGFTALADLKPKSTFGWLF